MVHIRQEIIQAEVEMYLSMELVYIEKVMGGLCIAIPDLRVMVLFLVVAQALSMQTENL
jgi:hypothetical protein